MDLWRYTFAELTGGIEPTGDSPAMEMAMPFGEVKPFEFDAQYGTAPVNGGTGLQDQALVRREGDATWTAIGIYLGDSMIVWGDARKGLGTELFLRCIEHRTNLPITKKMTTSGSRLIRRAHRISIKRALDAGEDVRPEVLAEYGIASTDTDVQSNA